MLVTGFERQSGNERSQPRFQVLWLGDDVFQHRGDALHLPPRLYRAPRTADICRKGKLGPHAGSAALYAEALCHVCFAAVLQAKNDPFKKEGSKKEAEEKAGSIKSNDKRTSTGIKLANKWVAEKA